MPRPGSPVPSTPVGFLSRADREIGVFRRVAPTTRLRLEFPRETGLILRCAGKAGNPFQTTQGNRLSCRGERTSSPSPGIPGTERRCRCAWLMGRGRCARPSGVPRGPATSTGSLASQRHPGKFPKVPGRRRGSQEGCQGPSRPSGRNRGLPLRRRRGQGPHLAKRWALGKPSNCS